MSIYASKNCKISLGTESPLGKDKTVLHEMTTAETCRVGRFSLMVVSNRAVHLFAFLGFNLP